MQLYQEASKPSVLQIAAETLLNEQNRKRLKKYGLILTVTEIDKRLTHQKYFYHDDFSLMLLNTFDFSRPNEAYGKATVLSRIKKIKDLEGVNNCQIIPVYNTSISNPPVLVIEGASKAKVYPHQICGALIKSYKEEACLENLSEEKLLKLQDELNRFSDPHRKGKALNVEVCQKTYGMTNVFTQIATARIDEASFNQVVSEAIDDILQMIGLHLVKISVKTDRADIDACKVKDLICQQIEDDISATVTITQVEKTGDNTFDVCLYQPSIPSILTILANNSDYLKYMTREIQDSLSASLSPEDVALINEGILDDAIAMDSQLDQYRLLTLKFVFGQYGNQSAVSESNPVTFLGLAD